MSASFFIELYVDDIVYYRSFFTEVLGFSVDRDEGSFMQLLKDGSKVLLHSSDVLSKDNHYSTAGLVGAQKGLGLELCFVVDDIRSYHEKAMAFSGLTVTDIVLQEWGAHDFRIVTPDGYYLRITEQPTK